MNAEPGPDWSVEVARQFLEVVGLQRRNGGGRLEADECWVGTDLAVYVRCRIGEHRDLRVARRLAEPHLEITTGRPARHAVDQGVYFVEEFHVLETPLFRDQLGYEWCNIGAPPVATWSELLDQTSRLETLKERAEDA